MFSITRPFLIFALLFMGTFSFAQTMSTTDFTENAGKVEWLPRKLDMGNIPFGQVTTREFVVKNISNDILVLTDVRSSCHCASVTWTQDAIPPGASAIIKASYDASEAGDFYKIITVKTNFDPKQTVALIVSGKVLEKQN